MQRVALMARLTPEIMRDGSALRSLCDRKVRGNGTGADILSIAGNVLK
jgi:hypothetical protein